MNADTKTKAWIVAADMGYGHLRAAFALKEIAFEGILTAGVDDGTTERERKLWSRVMRTYAAFSRAASVPVVGSPLFNLLDIIQRIPPITPGSNLSKPTYQIDILERLISRGLCSGMLERMRMNHQPLITTFYAPAVAAANAGYHPVYCIICDAEIHRVWVARSPQESCIVYLAPCESAEERLRAYGVPTSRILLTGFPLPDELLGGRSIPILKKDLASRIDMLARSDSRSEKPLTITYAVGGAGAQKEIGGAIARSLRKQLMEGSVRLNLVAGLHLKVRDYFDAVKKEITPSPDAIRVVFASTFDEYYRSFNNLLHDTHILWTKPSELSFYSALGIPIVMAPPLGSQEHYNRHWLLDIGAGIDQQNPRHSREWLFEMIESGVFAEAARAGFTKVRKLGTYSITEVLETAKLSAPESLAPASR